MTLPFCRAPGQAIEDGLIDTSRSMHVGIRGSVNDHEDITADAELVSGIHIARAVSSSSLVG